MTLLYLPEKEQQNHTELLRTYKYQTKTKPHINLYIYTNYRPDRIGEWRLLKAVCWRLHTQFVLGIYTQEFALYPHAANLYLGFTSRNVICTRTVQICTSDLQAGMWFVPDPTDDHYNTIKVSGRVQNSSLTAAPASRHEEQNFSPLFGGSSLDQPFILEF